MSPKPTRRRFITICAAAFSLPSGAFAESDTIRWTGIALGANASIVLFGLDRREALRLFSDIEADIKRLEKIFSLYRRDSVLMELNRTGLVRNPPAELLELLSLSRSIHHATEGAFDPTIQPLWRLYADAAAAGRLPANSDIVDCLDRTGLEHVAFDPAAVRFKIDGMALTFNGIAQGYIADRVAALLRDRGCRDVLVDMGEVAGLGHRPDGKPWRIGIEAPDGGLIGQVALSDRCIATSALAGTLLGGKGGAFHILDPRTGLPGSRWNIASVSADRAAVADGLSTAFCLMPRNRIDSAIGQFDSASLEALT